MQKMKRQIHELYITAQESHQYAWRVTAETIAVFFSLFTFSFHCRIFYDSLDWPLLSSLHESYFM